MDQFGSAQSGALVASLLLLLSMLLIRRRQGQSPRRRAEDNLDTVQAWPTQLVRVMTPLQRRAYEVLRQALPTHLILVQIPLAQFMRVSTRHSYVEWHKRAGRLRASFLVCDQHSSVIAAVDLRSSNETAREQARHARIVRVLESSGVTVHVWAEDGLPTVAQARQRFASLPSEQAQAAAAAQPESYQSRERMSGVSEVMGMEATDFAGLDTMPAPLDEPVSGSRAGRRPRPA